MTSHACKHDESITTVFELFRKTDPQRLLECLYPIGNGVAFEESYKARARIVAEFLDVLNSLAPDLDGSPEIPFTASDPSSLNKIASLSLPKALGSRIRMPFDENSPQRIGYLSLLLGHMMYGRL